MYTSRGKKYLRRRIKKRGGRRKQFGRKIKQPVQYFTRTQFISGQFAVVPGGVATGQGINFQLGNVPANAEFTALYDQYQIKAVKITLIPRISGNFVTDNTSTAQMGNVWSVLDYDDGNTPANLAVLLQYQNLKRTRLGQVHTRYLKPAVTQEIYATGIATAYSPKKNVWLDVANVNVEHYGMKLWLDAMPAGGVTVTYDATVKYYLAFKNVR